MAKRSRLHFNFGVIPLGKDCGCLMPPTSKFLAVPAGAGGELKDETLKLDLPIPIGPPRITLKPSDMP